MNIKEIEVKKVINRSNLPEANYVINPYVGCAHGCVYCYSRFMIRFTGHKGEKWGSFVDVKTNTPQLTRREIEKVGDGITILLSSVTDPYQPLERKYQLTRQVLGIVTKLPRAQQPIISILTKSDLVLRDIDLLQKLRQCEVGLSFSTSNEEARKIFEPYSSSVWQRIFALEELKRNGIFTYMFIGPILPGITELEKLFQVAQKCQVNFVMAENLNLRGSIWADVRSTIFQNFPNLLPLYEEVFKNPSLYWVNIQGQVEDLGKKYRIPTKLFFKH
jgi:DNA repair photolyase